MCAHLQKVAQLVQESLKMVGSTIVSIESNN
jgi:hypothetical protein